MTNPDHSKCPGNCFRPAGLALDATGRVWFTSDTTGEIYVLQKVNSQGGSPTTSGTLVTSTSAPNAAAGTVWRRESVLLGWLVGVVAGVWALL